MRSVLCLMAWLASADARARVVFVDGGATGADNGTSWQDAFTDLQDGLAGAVSGDEIWIAMGTYRPTAIADRTASFYLPAGVAVYGGFGGTEVARTERDLVRFPVRLTGEIGAPGPTDNSLNVLRAPGAIGSILSGVTISDGYDDVSGGGGGIRFAAETLVEDCIIESNYALSFGGGIIFAGTVRRTLFRNNSAQQGADIRYVKRIEDCVFEGGSGISSVNAETSDLAIIRCDFSRIGTNGSLEFGNDFALIAEGTTFRGRVFLGWVTQLSMVRCRFLDGETLCASRSTARFVACTARVGATWGRWLDVQSSPDVRIEGCTIWGGGGSAEAIRSDSASNLLVTNSVVWNTTNPLAAAVNGPTVSYSDIQGGWPGTGNIDLDPLLADPAAGDFRLTVGSPAIDAGDNAAIPPDSLDVDGDGDTAEPLGFDLAGVERRSDDPTTPDTGVGTPPIVDMGAHEYTTAQQDHVVAGAGAGDRCPNRIRTFDGAGRPTATLFDAYPAGAWGARVAAGDLDAAPDELVSGPGPGATLGPHVRAFRATGAPLPKVSFFAYGTLRYGAAVAAGSADPDPVAEMMTGAGAGAVFGPHVRGFAFDTGSVTPIGAVSFFAYGTLRWGVEVGTGDLDRDGMAEILTGPGSGPTFAPVVRGFDHDGLPVRPLGRVAFLAHPASGYGAVVAGGDEDGDGFAEIIVAAGPGPTASHSTRILGYDYDGTSIRALSGFDVTPFPNIYGARCGAADLTAAGRDGLIAAPGPDPAATTEVRGYEYTAASLGPVFPAVLAFPGLGHGATVAGADLGP